MADIFSKEKRSLIMSKVASKNTQQELFVRKLIHSMGYRFRLHRKDLSGKPDLVFPKYNKVIFVHGCFWHGHKGCKRASLPETNRKFWENKIAGNMLRDKINYARLRKKGWKHLVIWQCEIGKEKKEALIRKISSFLLKNGKTKKTKGEG